MKTPMKKAEATAGTYGKRYASICEKVRKMILTLDQLQNLTLDDVIGRKDLGRVRLATPEETSKLTGGVGTGPERGTLRDWRLIALDLIDRELEIILIGVNGREYWGTSSVLAADFERGVARTRSGSIYTLVDAGKGEPPISHVLHVCYMLSYWGMGKTLDVPEVFY